MAPAAVLVGAPGAGKSTVGRLLAAAWSCPFRDTDEEVAAAAGMSVQDVFVTEGEEGFRARERAVVLAALADPEPVLALGGGAVESQQIRDALAGLPVVWLQVDAATAVARVGLSGPRPVLLGNVRGQWSALLAARTPWYASVATMQIDTTDREPDAVAAQIVAALQEAGHE
jgi:shikimate kinase